MAVTIKSPREIELMREAGRILAKTHEELAKNLRPGMSTFLLKGSFADGLSPSGKAQDFDSCIRWSESN